MYEVVGEIAETVGTTQAGLALGQYGEIGGGEKSALEVAEVDKPSMRWLLLNMSSLWAWQSLSRA